jgi:myosin V
MLNYKLVVEQSQTQLVHDHKVTQEDIMSKHSKKTKKYVWCPHTEDVWISGEVEEEKNGKYHVVLKDNKKMQAAISDCLHIDNPSIMTEAVNDLISLSQVNDATILNSSRLRFMQKIIYTSIGAVLMALNPFETIPGLYGPRKIQQYRNIRDDNVQAHVYLIPARAYEAMCSFGKNQSLLISGESGAGKVFRLFFHTSKSDILFRRKPQSSVLTI